MRTPFALVSLAAAALYACSSGSNASSSGDGGRDSSVDASGSSSGSGSGSSSGSGGSSSGSSSGGSSSGSSGSSSGSSGGDSGGSSGGDAGANSLGFSPQTEIGSTSQNPDGGPPNNLVYIALESLDIPNACTEQTPNLSNSNAIFLEVYQGSGSAVSPGTYDLGTSGTVMVQAGYATYSASCQKTIDAATAGTITISAVNGSTIEGSYALTFSQGTAAGNFNVPICPLFGNGQSDAGCQ